MGNWICWQCTTHWLCREGLQLTGFITAICTLLSPITEVRRADTLSITAQKSSTATGSYTLKSWVHKPPKHLRLIYLCVTLYHTESYSRRIYVSSKRTAVDFITTIRTSPTEPIASEGREDTLTIGTQKLCRITTCMYCMCVIFMCIMPASNFDSTPFEHWSTMQ